MSYKLARVDMNDGEEMRMAVRKVVFACWIVSGNLGSQHGGRLSYYKLCASNHN